MITRIKFDPWRQNHCCLIQNLLLGQGEALECSYHQVPDSYRSLRETVKNTTLLNLVVALHTIWQFCSHCLKTGSVGGLWRGSRAVLVPRGAQACSAVSVQQPCCPAGAGHTKSAARGEPRAADPPAWRRRGSPGSRLCPPRAWAQPLVPPASCGAAGAVSVCAETGAPPKEHPAAVVGGVVRQV